MFDDLAERVDRGARLLDCVEPGWSGRIALDRLAMESCDYCILGQLHGDFTWGFREVLAKLPNSRLYSAAEHGFTLRPEEQDCFPHPDDPKYQAALARFAVLADLWRGQVRERSEAKP